MRAKICFMYVRWRREAGQQRHVGIQVLDCWYLPTVRQLMQYCSLYWQPTTMIIHDGRSRADWNFDSETAESGVMLLLQVCDYWYALARELFRVATHWPHTTWRIRYVISHIGYIGIISEAHNSSAKRLEKSFGVSPLFDSAPNLRALFAVINVQRNRGSVDNRF